jgi:hypothetical protein
LLLLLLAHLAFSCRCSCLTSSVLRSDSGCCAVSALKGQGR